MRLRHLFSKPKAAELNDELKFHFESLVQENPSKRQSFGGPTEQRRVVRLKADPSLRKANGHSAKLIRGGARDDKSWY